MVVMLDIDWQEFLNRHDFCGLIEMGAPKDEYKFDAEIFSQSFLPGAFPVFTKNTSEEELAFALRKIMKSKRFTLAPDDLAWYRAAATELSGYLKNI
jgi:hypothetical protein